MYETNAKMYAEIQNQFNDVKSNIIDEINKNIESANIMSLNLMNEKINKLQTSIDEKTNKYIDSQKNMIIE